MSESTHMPIDDDKVKTTPRLFVLFSAALFEPPREFCHVFQKYCGHTNKTATGTRAKKDPVLAQDFLSKARLRRELVWILSVRCVAVPGAVTAYTIIGPTRDSFVLTSCTRYYI